MPSTENLTVAGSLFIKATLLAAKWAGASRKKGLESIAAMAIDEKDREIVFLRDRVEQLELQVSILRKSANKHTRAHRIHAHVALTVLSLLLERVIERECEDTWRNIRDDLRQVKLAQLSSPNGEVWQVTEPTQTARTRLKTLKIPPPGPIARMV